MGFFIFISMIENILIDRYGDFLDGLDIYETSTSLILSRIVIKPDVRQEGIGSKILNDLVNYADKNKQIIALTPSSDYGGNKSRLIQFYKRFGFKHNKGHYKNFEFRDAMIRYPKTMNEGKTKNISILKIENTHKNKWDVKESTKSNIKKLFREHVELSQTDATSDVSIYTIIYNTREIGSIGITMSDDMVRSLELVFIQLRPDYNKEAIMIMGEVVMALWKTFADINYILLTPQAQSRTFWHKVGANRLNDQYLMISKGH